MFSHVADVACVRFRRGWIDLRDALRGLRGGGGTTAWAFGLLTLTMAAGTVTFSVVDGVALRPLPYTAPEQLVSISLPSVTPGRVLPASPQNYFSWLESTQTLESLAAGGPTGSLQLEVGGVVEILTAKRVTANLFNVLGVYPAAGRAFGARARAARCAGQRHLEPRVVDAPIRGRSRIDRPPPAVCPGAAGGGRRAPSGRVVSDHR